MMSLLPTATSAAAVVAAPGPLAPSVDTSSSKPSKVVVVRLAASLALLASSAFLLLGENVTTGGRIRTGPDAGVVGRYLSDESREDPLLTNLAIVGGTKSASEAISRTAAAGTKEEEEKAPDSVTPVYWHIYKAGGTSVKSVLIDCLDLTTATNAGVLRGHDKDSKIGLMRAGGKVYVNVDTISWAGVDRAAEIGLAESGLADAVVTPIIHKTVSTIFSPQHRALLFTVFRHPVDRLVSQYYYLQEATWEGTYNPAIAQKSLGEYAWMYSNRMMHQLTGNYGKLSESDLDLAKEVVRDRMIVGLQSDTKASVRRFVRYFGWGRSDGNVIKYEECIGANFPRSGEVRRNRHSHPKVEEGSKDWDEVAAANKWDIQLYEYARQVYDDQGRTMFSDSDKEETGGSPIDARTG